MPSIGAAKFRIECLRLLDEVEATGRAVDITKRGKVVARLMPPERKRKKSIFGCMKGTILYMAPTEELFSTGEVWDAEK